MVECARSQGLVILMGLQQLRCRSWMVMALGLPNEALLMPQRIRGRKGLGCAVRGRTGSSAWEEWTKGRSK